MQKSRLQLIVISLLLFLLTGCKEDLPMEAFTDPIGYGEHKYREGHLNINNRTGHAIYINGSHTRDGSGVSYSDSSYGPDTYDRSVTAFMEEYDVAGNRTWGYYYQHRYWFGSGSTDVNLTGVENQYNVNDISTYPVILRKLTATNKTGYKVRISDTNNVNDKFLELDIDQTGFIDRSGLVTDARSFYFFIFNNNSYSSALRMTFSRSFLRNNTSFDIPAELVAKGVLIF